MNETHEEGRKDKKDVYFIQAMTGGPIKIGISHNPNERLFTFQYHSPQELKILTIIENGDYEIETMLHRRFARYRLHGEWFEPVPELMMFIRQMREAKYNKDFTEAFIEELEEVRYPDPYLKEAKPIVKELILKLKQILDMRQKELHDSLMSIDSIPEIRKEKINSSVEVTESPTEEIKKEE